MLPDAWAVRLEQQKQQSLIRTRYTRSSPEGPFITVEGREFLAFCSNDYLGLAADPRLKKAAIEGLEQYGLGSGASHYISGHCQAHEDLESELAAYTGREAALLLPSGFMANVGIVSALVGRKDTVIQDRLNHASLIDGARLSGADFKRFPHNDLAGLSRQLAQSQGNRLVAVDGVFSMDGDLAPLGEIADICRSEQALCLVDDAHGFGVLGPNGAGSIAEAGLDQSDIPLLMATLGKAIGCYGAFVAGSRDWIEYLEQFTRTAIYTTATPPLLATAALAALEIAQSESWRREQLQALITYWRESAEQRGWHLMESRTPIQPVMIGDSESALQVSQSLRDQGVLVPAIRPPTVPAGQARLRITFSAMHQQSHIDRLVDALEKALRDQNA